MVISFKLACGTDAWQDTTNFTTVTRQGNMLIFAGETSSAKFEFLDAKLADEAIEAIKSSYLHGHVYLTIIENEAREKYEIDDIRHTVPAHLLIKHYDDVFEF